MPQPSLSRSYTGRSSPRTSHSPRHTTVRPFGLRLIFLCATEAARVINQRRLTPRLIPRPTNPKFAPVLVR
jgi:hypothetical protein